ncbi:hypothetical protein PCE1_003220 [Barthelona sp. PCE]
MSWDNQSKSENHDSSVDEQNQQVQKPNFQQPQQQQGYGGYQGYGHQQQSNYGGYQQGYQGYQPSNGGYNSYAPSYNNNHDYDRRKNPWSDYNAPSGGYNDDAFYLEAKDFSEAKLEPFERDFYKEHEDVTKFTDEEVAEIYNEHEARIDYHEAIPRPIKEFYHMNFPTHMLDTIYKRLRFEKPSSIQACAWPALMSGKDLIGVAKTGSGKTLAFALPGIIHTAAQQHHKEGPVMLVLTPTRELAMQIVDEMKNFCHYRDMPVVPCYGGTRKSAQLRWIRYGCSICVGTPGRIIDLIKQGVLMFDRVSYVVLDEADRMLEMGFEDQVRSIVGQTRPDRQTLMFSATWPKEVVSLANDFISNPVKLVIAEADQHRANKAIKQEFVDADSIRKQHDLLNYLMTLKRERALIFVAKKNEVERLVDLIQSQGMSCEGIHGDKTQSMREQSLNRFKRGHCQVLIGTDVVSRGVDIRDLEVVINYDFPGNCTDYIHRIGRTGRAGKEGISRSYFSIRGDSKCIKDLLNILREAEQEIPEFLLQAQRFRGGHRGGRRGGRRRYRDRRQGGGGPMNRRNNNRGYRGDRRNHRDNDNSQGYYRPENAPINQ